MNSPEHEIAAVVELLAASPSPDEQKSAFQQYVSADASFRHPLCKVDTGVMSRDNILAIYQWYRVMSPKIDINVNNIVYDRDQDILILDITQTFHICFFPFNLMTPVPSRLLTRIHLRRENELHYIASQEDFYHPDEFTSLLLPPLTPVVRFILDSTSTISAVNAKIASGLLGVWRAAPNGAGERNGGENWNAKKD